MKTTKFLLAVSVICALATFKLLGQARVNFFNTSTNLSDLNAWTAITNVTLVEPAQLWIDTSVESCGPGNNGRYYRVTAL